MTSDPMRVCVVDDELRLRELLVREIAAMGFATSGFRSAEEAWPALECGEFDTLLVDLNLPGLGGMELFEQVHARRPEIAVVILTGFGTLDSAVQALRWGASDYLTKPCNLDQIEAILTRVERERRRTEVMNRAHAEAAAGGAASAAETIVPSRRLEDLEREQILAAMVVHHGSKPAVATALGISLRTLYNKLHAYRTQGHIR